MNHEAKCSGGSWTWFLTRDLPYVGSGILVVVGLARAVGFSVADLLVHSVSETIGAFVLFLVAAYFVGMFVEKGLSAIRIFRSPNDLGIDPAQWAKERMLVAQTGEKLNCRIVNDFELSELYAGAASTLGSGSLLGGVFWLIALIARLAAGYGLDSNALIYLVVVLLLFGTLLISIRERSRRLKQQAALMEEFKKVG